jgi:hypothetical protein
MNSLALSSAPGKHNPAGERELLIHALRTAVARYRLVTNALETIGVSLRHNAVTPTRQWLGWTKSSLSILCTLDPRRAGPVHEPMG